MTATFDTAEFRRACSRFATGITVSTVLGADGTPHGLTANSFTSVSLAPPMVLICLAHQANVLPQFRTATYFGINILAEDQTHLARRFAARGIDRFDGLIWHKGLTGVPLLDRALARFECHVRDVVEAGDHAIFIGEVVSVESNEGQPLVYFGSSYHLVQPKSD